MLRIKRLCAVVAAWILLLTTASGVRAGIVYSNFGAGNSYNTSVGWTLGNDFSGDNIAVGDTFTVSQTGTLSQITVALTFDFGVNAATISLRSDLGGTPGAVLESWSVSSLPPDNGNPQPLTTVTDVSNAALVAGTNYWVVVSTTASSGVTWMWNNIGTGGNPVAGNHATSYDGGSTWSASNDSQSAFSVTENLPTASTPEPGTLTLLTIGFGMLAGRRLRHRRG
jgi:hypothetical protein